MKTIRNTQFGGLLNPRLALLVTCCDTKGNPNVLTIAWHTPLSHHPPLLGISIGLTRYSHQLIQSTGEFAVNIMGASNIDAVRICGEYSGELDNKFSIAKLDTQLAEKISVPVLTDALAILECKLHDQVLTGDHTLFIGEVVNSTVREDIYDHGWALDNQNSPLLFSHQDSYIRPGERI